MNIACIGSGYVGSVISIVFACLGHTVTVIDNDCNKINKIKEKKSPIFEKGLEVLIENLVEDRLLATNSYSTIKDMDLVMICVGTPLNKDGSTNLDYMKLAARNIAKNLNPCGYTVISIKSTTPVNSLNEIINIIQENSGLINEEHFSVVCNPEFLREGTALEDFLYPERIVVGSTNTKASEIMKNLYSDILNRTKYYLFDNFIRIDETAISRKTSYFETDPISAMMIKYASNAYLAIKISFINELARLCEVTNANVLDVAKGIGMDSRIGNQYFQISPGWGGSCLPKDTAELFSHSVRMGRELSIVKAAIESNNQMKKYVVDKMRDLLGYLEGRTIGIIGLTFKPNTDDSRNAQTGDIIRELIYAGAQVKVHDPQGNHTFRMNNPELNVIYCEKAEEVSNEADILVLLTNWEEYLHLNWNLIYANLRKKLIFDTRNFLPQKALEEMNFQYEGIGI
ncbi:UDP-glucose dehydrogenase family protein [Brevibacillus sp. SAFN-007a]|uniref:UDP-glucose dehydrogenase family protein n=1 Tax=Brevibacillus sp. SAFN-007a TaxID=3436862 RepID=UPI003F81DE5A